MSLFMSSPCPCRCLCPTNLCTNLYFRALLKLTMVSQSNFPSLGADRKRECWRESKQRGAAMSSGRSRVPSKISEDELNLLIFKLQELIPQLNQRQASKRRRASKILKETCSYIKKLQREADDLSERLSQLLDSADTAGVDTQFLRSFLQQ